MPVDNENLVQAYERLAAKFDLDLERLLTRPDQQRLRDVLANSEIVILGVVEHVQDKLLPERGEGVQFIGTLSVGRDHLDFSPGSRGISIEDASTANAPEVAELAIWYLLSAFRQVVDQVGATSLADRRIANSLNGKTIGIVGAGSTAFETASRLSCFGVDILVWTRRPASHSEFVRLGARFVPLEELAARCDAIVLQLPLNSDTRSLVDAHLLSAMRPGAFLVNVAREALVEQNALIQALTSGTLAGYWSDVYSDSGGSAPRQIPGMRTTPHLAGVTEESLARMHTTVLNKLEEWLIDKCRAGGRPSDGSLG